MKILERIARLLSQMAGRSVPKGDPMELAGAAPDVGEGSSAGRPAARRGAQGDVPEGTDSWAEAVRAFQLGFNEFTTERDTIGFYIDPENRWAKLAEDVFKPGMEEIYEEKLCAMRDTTRGARLSERLGKLEQDTDVSAYGAQLRLPNIDLAVEKAKTDATVVKAECGQAGRRPCPFRLVFGILAVQGILDVSDREVCKCVSESPYLQYFLGYASYSSANTVDPSSLVHFKKRLDWETMEKLNEVVRKGRADPSGYGRDTGASPKGKRKAKAKVEAVAADGAGKGASEGNGGTLILDATCGPVNIRYPQDFSLLNEGRLVTESIIERICGEHGIPKPRTYVKVIQKEAKGLAKSKKKTGEKIRHVLRLELNAIERNLGYIDGFLGGGSGVELTCEEIEKIGVVRAVYAQQKYMYEKKEHRVTNRIVSISMPFIRPIPRGKADRPTEFGPKYDIAVDEDGFSWVTHFSFDNRNEGGHLKEAVESYKEKRGRYPERVLVDQIYRNKENREYCKEKGIRISGPRLGRKPRDEDVLAEQRKAEIDDMVDRIEVERHFSRQKRCFGIERIVERTAENISHAVGMSVFLDNVVPVGF